MFSIGEFSYSTGLAIKTLRYYDEIGLLPPQQVDSHNGYRSYSAAQMKDVGLLRLLRAAGMSIYQMKQCLADKESFGFVMEQRRQELDFQRSLEDWALETAIQWHEEIDPAIIQTRMCKAQPWIGVESTIDLNDLKDSQDFDLLDEVGELLDEQFEVLTDELQACGVIARQPFDTWMTLASDKSKTSKLSIQFCAALTQPIPEVPHIEGIKVLRGELPTREEAFILVTTPLSEMSEDALANDFSMRLPGGPMPVREALALAVYAESRGTSLGIHRQRTRVEGDNAITEVSITLP
ncbi:MerR family transcriptional regulator [Corynebacterium sp. H127]